MTNRESILKKFGDYRIAYKLIKREIYFKNRYERRHGAGAIIFKFNDKIYLDIDDAKYAVNKWLDEEEETSDEDNKTTRIVCPPPVHDWSRLSDKEREECARGCVHPEDTWTKWWCGDCGAYAKYGGCRGPRGLTGDEKSN